MITERLNYIFRNQQRLGADECTHIKDALNRPANIDLYH